MRVIECGPSRRQARRQQTDLTYPSRCVDPAILPTIGCIAAVLGLVGFLARPTATQRALRRLPLLRIADAPPDRGVRIEGAVETSLAALTAPLTGRTCAYWRVEIDVQSPFARNVRIEDGQEARVRDASGVVAIDLAAARVQGGARFDIRGSTRGIGGFSRRLHPRLEALLREHGVADSAFSRIVWGRELIVAAGDRVACAGRVRRDIEEGAGDNLSYRGERSRLVLQPSSEQPVLVAVLEDTSG